MWECIHDVPLLERTEDIPRQSEREVRERERDACVCVCMCSMMVRPQHLVKEREAEREREIERMCGDIVREDVVKCFVVFIVGR